MCSRNQSPEEFFPLVDYDGQVIGKAARWACHNGSMLLHPVVHLHVFHPQGTLYLQKRPSHKDIQPGKWDTSVGGHVGWGESVDAALLREAWEELGLQGFTPIALGRYVFHSAEESELVHSFYTFREEPPTPNPDELEDGRFWSLQEILEQSGNDVFTPNFEQEFRALLLPLWPFTPSRQL
jgi:isopentenyldiphosphate isomerase